MYCVVFPNFLLFQNIVMPQSQPEQPLEKVFSPPIETTDTVENPGVQTLRKDLERKLRTRFDPQNPDDLPTFQLIDSLVTAAIQEGAQKSRPTSTDKMVLIFGALIVALFSAVGGFAYHDVEMHKEMREEMEKMKQDVEDSQRKTEKLREEIKKSH